MPGSRRLPEKTWTKASDSQASGDRSSIRATSREWCTRRGAATGVGCTRE